MASEKAYVYYRSADTDKKKFKGNVYAFRRFSSGTESEVETASGKVLKFKTEDLNPWDPSHDAEDVAEDVTTINGFGEASLLICMKRRLLEKFNIYTYVSDIVLCLNPYMGLPEMTEIREYPDQKEYNLGTEPTVYATAHIAYHGAMNPTADPRNQSRVVWIFC